MKIVTLTKQNKQFDFLTILVKNRDFDLDRKNCYRSTINPDCVPSTDLLFAKNAA